MISPGSSNKCDQENLLQNPPFPNHPPSPVHFNLVQIQNLNFQEFRLNLRSRLLSQGFPPIIFSVGNLSVRILNDIPATSDAFRRIHIKSTLCLSVQLQMKMFLGTFFLFLHILDPRGFRKDCFQDLSFPFDIEFSQLLALSSVGNS